MSTTTEKLALFKYDPSTDGAQTFNIKQAMNDNWDKIDDAVKDIDTTLQNNNPRNWGIGAESKSLASGDDLNNVWRGGLYSWGTGVSNVPFSYGLMIVLSPGAYAAGRVQIAYDRVNKTIAIRWLDTKWSPWEYQNPPMTIGVEYRTTERYLGKPVYVKVVDFGALPNNTTKRVDPSITDFSKLVDMRIMIAVSDGSYHVNMSIGGDTSGTINNRSWFKLSTGGISIKTFIDQSADSAIVTLKYTKTTD